MARTTIVFGVLLILLGLGFFLGTGSAHITALIPAAVGVLLLLLGRLATRDAWRMHAMHLVALVALLGVLGAIQGPIRSAIHGQNVEFGARLAAQILMALLCAALVALCVKSFVAARLRRKNPS
jgi:lysylphosphatidylglycerol synthetase-like protein (DUF2156 family)